MKNSKTLHRRLEKEAGQKPVPSKKKKIVAAAALASVALAATVVSVTGAGYRAEQPVPPSTVVAGHMDITMGQSQGWFDTYGVRTGTIPTAIDMATFAIVPGGSVQKAEEISIELSGDNIKAELTAGIQSLTGDLVAQGLTGSVSLVKGSYSPTSGTEPKPDDIATITPIADNAVAPQFSFNSAVAPADGKYTVVTALVFGDAATAGNGATAVLQDISFRLTQVREVRQQSKPWVIPDAGLRTIISRQLRIPEAGMTEADALNLTGLNLRSAPETVESIEGLQLAKNLASLTVYGAQIKSLEPVRNLDQLGAFSGEGTLISDLSPLEGHAYLTQVDLIGMPNVPNIDALTPMRNLQYVNISSNPQFTEIEALTDKLNLVVVYLSNTNVLSLEPLRNDAALQAVNALGTPVTDWDPVSHVETVYGRP